MRKWGSGNLRMGMSPHHVSQDGLDVEVDESIHPPTLGGLEGVGPVVKLQNEGALRVPPVLQNLVRPYVQDLVPEEEQIKLRALTLSTQRDSDAWSEWERE